MAEFRFSVNADQVADRLGQAVAMITSRLRQEVENLSVAAHAFVIRKANQELTGYKRIAFLGEDNKNVRWSKIGGNMWVVEIDEKASWVEEGRDEVFMDWLLNKNPKAKTAKDGSKYASIPFTHQRGGKSVSSPVLAAMVKNELKNKGISMRKLEHNEDGSPKLGILHKLSIQEPGTRQQFPGLFSAPRGSEESRATGLPPHEGIFKLQDTVVVQRQNQQGKVVKEAVTFRTISSKHRGYRWMYPKVEPFNSLKAAHEWALKEWEEIIKRLEDEIRQA